MRRDMPRPRLLLLLPTATYRTEAFVQAAATLDVTLTVASEVPSSFEKLNPGGLLTIDLFRLERAVEQVRLFAAQHPIDAVCGVDDDTAVVAAAIAKALRLPGNEVEATQAARNKYQQRVLLRDAGVSVPNFGVHRLEDDPRPIASRTQYPAVVKPLSLSASRGVMRIDNEREFVTAHGRLSRILEEAQVVTRGLDPSAYLVEEYVHGNEVAVEGLIRDGVFHLLAMFDKPDPLHGPFFEETIYVTPSRAPPSVQSAIESCVASATRAIGLTTGPVHAEVRYDRGKLWMIELAARSIGGKCSRVLRFGDERESLERMLLRVGLRGGPIPPRERDARGVMMLPTPKPGLFREVRGTPDAERVRGITEILLTAHPGQPAVPLPEGSRYLGFMFARASDPATVEAALREAYAKLEIVIDERGSVG